MALRICSPQLGISPRSNQGGTVFDREMLRGLAGLGAQVAMPLPRGEEYEAVPGWQVRPAGRHRFYYYEYNWIFRRAALEFWRKGGFDLYRVHSPTIAPLGLWMQRLTRRPLTAHYHHIEAGKRIHNLITRRALPRYDLVTADSHFTLEQLRRLFGYSAANSVVTYPGVSEVYRPQPASAALRTRWELGGRFVLLTLGVLTPRKNLHFLVELFAGLHVRFPQLALVIAGSGPEMASLTAHAAALGVAQAVRFPGYIAEADKVDWYNLADVFVFPSLLEGFGMVVAEAMACALPVVSSNAASLPEVVGDAGLMASPTDAAGFAAHIERLLGDESLRRALAHTGEARVRERFSWQRTARTTFDAYAALAAR